MGEMDLSSIVESHRPARLQVTWKGCPLVHKYCEERLLQYLGDNVLTWERQGRQLPFPLHVKLCIQFVPFKDDLIIKNSGVDFRSVAFLHYFFMRPVSVEEYRTKWRHEISEWFATVNQKDGVEWIVVFDSTKAREKRNRGAVMERIRNDFARFTNRILEINENSANTVASLQTITCVQLLASLDSFISSEEGRLSDLKEDYYKLDFDYLDYSRSQMRITRLYFSLNAIERVLAKLDELDTLVSLIISYFTAQAARPKWLCKGSVGMGKGCPLLSVMGEQEELHGDAFLVDIRSFIAAHKMIASLLLYLERVKHVAETKTSNIVQIKTDFAAIVLRHASHCFNAVFENVAALKMNVDERFLHCWTLLLCLETSQIVDTIIESVFAKNLTYFICTVTVLKCKAIAALCRAFKQGLLDAIIVFIEDGMSNCEVAKRFGAGSMLREALSGTDRFAHFMETTFERSVILLKQFGWERQRRLLGYEFATLFLDFDRPEFVVPYLLEAVTLFIQDDSPLLVKILPSVVEHIETNASDYRKKLQQYYLILSLRSKTQEEQSSNCQKLFDSLGSDGAEKLVWSCSNWKRYMPLSLSLPCFVPHIIATPGELLKIAVCIQNVLPMSIPMCKLNCVFRKISSSEPIEQCGNRPQYKCSFAQSDQIARFGCISKGEFSPSRKWMENQEHSASDGQNTREGEDVIIFSVLKGGEHCLPCGSTTLQLYAQASHVGVYALSHVEVVVKDALTFLFLWSDIPEIEFNPSFRPTCFVHQKMPTVHLKPFKGDCLFAGVLQLLELELYSGSESEDNQGSCLEIRTSEKDAGLEFWDPRELQWLKSCKMFVEKSLLGATVTVPVYTCCLLRKLVEFSSEDNDTYYSKTVIIRWRGLEWTLPVSFTPLLKIETSTSLLEDKLLFELRFLRPSSAPWVMVPEEAILTASSFDLAKPARLLNPKLTDMLPLSSYRLVWMLGNEGNMTNDVEEFKLDFKYHIRPNDGILDKMPIEGFNRTYSYEDTFAVANKKASYELFAQILSAQPGAVLCRVNSPCDLIVSLRSLSNRVETVVISIDANPEYWAINDRHKFVYVKESGLGQTSFSIVPNMVGFLPYPSVVVYRCQHQRTNSDKSISSRCEQSDFGPRLPSFVRSGGKQIHVLGLYHSASDQKLAGEKTKRLKDAKSRIAKLFD